jgi:hypothetical protein
MLQNVSAKRDNKKVTNRDFARILCVSFLPYFGGGVNQYDNAFNSSMLAPTGVASLYCVRGTGTNRAKIVWQYVSNATGDPRTRGLDKNHMASWHCIVIKSIGVEYDSEKIYSKLKINTGEMKMILNVNLCASWMKKATHKEREFPSTWGLFFLNPKAESFGSSTGGWFHKIVIFTPKPELFNDSGLG